MDPKLSLDGNRNFTLQFLYINNSITVYASKLPLDGDRNFTLQFSVCLICHNFFAFSFKYKG